MASISSVLKACFLAMPSWHFQEEFRQCVVTATYLLRYAEITSGEQVCAQQPKDLNV